MNNNKQKKQYTQLDILVYFVLGFFFIFTILSLDFSKASFWIVFSFFIMGIFYFYKIISAKKNISLYRVYYIFAFVFMFYAPLQQYLSGTVFWASNGLAITYSDDDYLKANLVLTIFTICFEIGYHLFNSKKETKKKNYVVIPSDFAEGVMIALSLLAFATLFISGNITNRSGYDFENQNISGQVNNILRFIPVSCFIITFLQKDKNGKKNTFALIVYIIEIFIIFFPLNGGMSRFLLFGTYMALIALLFSHGKHKSLFFLLFIIGFFFVFSSFNYFKTHNITDFSEFSLSLVNFNHSDFDAYQMLMASIKYVEREGVFFGGNILTVLLCWIPRSIWPGKMEPSGAIVAGYWGSWYTNLSCPIYAEFFLAFGYIGIILGAFIISWILKKIDSFDYSQRYFKKGVFCVLSGFLIYILRGALLPTVSYFIATILSLALIYVVNQYCSRIYVKKLPINIKSMNRFKSNRC